MRLEGLVYVLAFTVTFYSETWACPAECNCFGFNGEWIADCARKELTSVTYADFDVGTTEIHLQYNFIESLDEATFDNVPNLKHLYLQSNRISELPQDIFKSLVNLETLRLNSNRIRDVGTFKFQNLTKLKLLYIHNNDLTDVQEEAFTGIRDSIEQISVATNPNLVSIDINSLKDMNSLKMIDMSGSALTRLDRALTSDLIAGGSIEKVYTYDIDTLICDRQLQNYLTYMNLNPTKIFGRATMVCGQPENLKGRSVTVVDERHFTTTGSCPSECECISSGSSYIADCSSRGLTEVPSGFAPETTEIALQNNSIGTLTGNNFLHLNNLQYLYLHNSGVSEISLDAFTGATALKQLTLNNNNIGGNIAGIFNNLVALEVLNLNENQLTTIRPNTFPSMPNLVQFSANGNAIQRVIAGAFDSMVSLKYFGMGRNSLTELPDDIFAKTPNLFFVDVSENGLLRLPMIPATVEYFEANYNNIRELNSLPFANARTLRVLELSHSAIYIIEDDAFTGAENLQYILLNGNKMGAVEDGHFMSAKSLLWLDLSYNPELTHISDNAFASQRYTMQWLSFEYCGLTTNNGKAFSSLQHPDLSITLENNPWNCECELQDLSDVIRTSPSTYDNPKCQQPESEQGNSITEVDYLSACSGVVNPSPTTTTKPAPPKPTSTAHAVKSDQTALIISLTIVLAVLVFAVAMFFVLRQSKPKNMYGGSYAKPPESTHAYVNPEYNSDEKPTTEL